MVNYSNVVMHSEQLRRTLIRLPLLIFAEINLVGFAAVKWIVDICLDRVRDVCHPISPTIVDLRISGLHTMD